jgi:AcrR family transcriptional regulator
MTMDAVDLVPPAPGAPKTRKEAVRDAALTLFAERGYHATTINDIGRRLSLRGPSLYNHIESKQQLLADIVGDFLRAGLRAQEIALSSEQDPVDQLRTMVDLHVRFNMRFRREAFVGNREVKSLDEPLAGELMELRDRYARNLLEVIERGVRGGAFDVLDTRMTGFAIIQMGFGVAVWFRPDGPLSEDETSKLHQELALRMVGVSG